MGSGTSKQKLGARVMDALKRLEAATQMQTERMKQLENAAPETQEVIVQSIADSFARCAPFSDSLLLVAFAANAEETKRVLTKACKKVLSAPIDKAQFAWFEVCASAIAR